MSYRWRDLVILLAYALLPASTAWAQANCVSPGLVRIPAGRAPSAPITLNWLSSAASSGGVVAVAGSNTVLLDLPPVASTGTSFRETIVLPPSTQQILTEQGARQIVVTRVWGTPCVALIQFGSSLGGPLAFTRLQLRFEKGSSLRVIPRGDELQVFADISYGGSGQLRARWEIAEPATTSGTPIFRVVSRVQRQLGGGGHVSLESPELPTNVPGLFLVRLVSEDPTPNFVEPTLRYYVTNWDENASLQKVPATGDGSMLR